MESGTEVVPPFIGNEQGQLWAFDRLSNHGVESEDVARTEIYDSEGRYLRPIVDGINVRYEFDPTKAPNPGRVSELIREFFQGVTRKRHQVYRTDSEACQSLAELVELLVRWGNQTVNVAPG